MRRLIVLSCCVSALCIASPAAAADTGPPVLQAEIARLGAPAEGIVGVAAWRTDGQGPRVLINAGQPFPMGSTFKVAVACKILADVDAGRLSLDRMVPVDYGRMVESEGLAATFHHPGVAVSVDNLLELMLTVSDNTAADVLTELAGGPAAVTQWVRAQGIEGLRVDRDTAGLLRDFFHIGPGPFPQALEAAVKADPKLEERSDKLNPAFDRDPRDTATPQSMANLLDRAFAGKLLSPASTKVLTEIMQRNTTGKARIRGRLPDGVTVAEKTGTIGASLNDVGMITLPGGAGKVIVAVFIKQSAKPFPEREQAIADISRAVYDYYLFAGTR
jgi:beta-lactamase class A